MLALLHLAAVAVAAALLLWAGACDLRRYRIPNGASLGLALAFALFAVTLPGPALLDQQIDLARFAADGALAFDVPAPALDWLRHLAVGAAALAIGFAAFAFRYAGGGDGKLFAAVALWAGPEQVVPATLLMGLIGGVLALAQVLTVQQLRAREAGLGLLAVGLPGRGDLRRAKVPYGVAISGAGLYVLWGLAAPLL